MKKKVFSLMMMLLFAFIGVTKAEVVTIGEGTSTYYYYPVNMYFNYSLTEELYTPEEIGTAGTINAISFYYDYSSSFSMNNITLYMKNVTREAFASTTDMEPLALGDIVWTGTFAAAGSGWVTIVLDTPFEYDGASNLLVAAFDGTSGYPGSAFKFRTTPCTGYKGIHWYSDSYTPDPYNTASGFSGSKSYTQYRANIQLDITPGGGGAGDQLHVKYMDGDVEVLDQLNLGVRPIDAWMAPFDFTMYTEGRTYTVNILDFTPSDGLFSVSGEDLPFHVIRNEDVALAMTTNGTEAGVIERQFVAITAGDRAAHIWPVTVELYAPEVPDVWELACEEATTFPFVEVPANAHGTVLHNDYTLPFPEIPEGYDAVYKLVFDQDQMLNAEVTYGENGKVALYREGFEGEGGPMATNNYSGIVGGGGATGLPFEAQIGEGTTTSTYFPYHSLWNYSLSENLFLASELAEAGVTSAPMTSLSWYVASSSNTTPQNNISIWMGNVDDEVLTSTSHSTAGMTLVYTGNNVLPVAGQWNEFVFNEGTFSWDGHSNVVIVCQRNNGSYQGSISWQTHNPGFTAMCYHYSDTNGGYDVANTPYSGMYTSSTNRANIIMKSGNRSNRDYTALEEGFEGGTMPAGWTSEGANTWSIGTGDYSTSTGAHTGTYNAKITHVSTGSQTYLVTPAMDLSGSTQATLNFAYVNRSWAGDIDELGVYYRVNGGSWNQLFYTTDAHSTWTESGNIALAGLAANYQIGFLMVDDYGYGVGIDDVVVTCNGAGGGGGGGDTPTPDPISNMSYGPVIENAAVEAGTYYLVASSTTPDFEVTINAENMPCPAVEGFAFNPTPADNEDGVEPGSVTLRWMIPEYATGWRLIFGSTYHPEPGHVQTVMYPEDGSFTRNMANSFTVRNLWNNTNYFWRVEFNNDGCPDGVSSPVWGFTTHLNIPNNLTADDYTVFNDETITLHWNAVVDRTYRQYFIYRDGVKVGETQVNNIGNTTFTDGPLAYNMDGYTYYVTAIYDEGESAPSDPVTVKVSGYGDVEGHVYEQDGETGIANATVTMVGQDEFGDSHTYNFTTDGQGHYTGHVYAGSYNGSAACNGYQPINAPVQGNPIAIAYNNTTTPIDYILDENFYTPCTVIAQYYPDSTDVNAPYVKVYWGCGLPGEEIVEPFETGDFSQFDWQLDPTYPWSITTNNPYEGTYCMKSGGAGVANVVSNMSVTVNIPSDGVMSFFGKISCESNWDYGYFYIDGVQKGNYTGAGSWAERTFDITAGDHTFKWSYEKDGSVNSNDDCFYVDYITFYRRPEPALPGMTYDFENSSMQGWTSVDADGDGYGWYVASEIMSTGYGHNGSNDCVLSQSYNNSVGILYPDNYLVSPQVQLGGILRFYACAQDASYAAEHFGVAVSTTNTNPGSFSMVQEWTMTAKAAPADNGKPARNSRSGRAQGNWYEYTVDLSAYSGMGYVAIRHFNCSDMFYLDVDDITIGEPGKGLPTNDRAFSHYRVYRTNCYNDGPYTLDNTVILACELHDTLYIDVSWPDAAPGVYKWGVGCVYNGNRGEEIESPISWSEPVSITPDKATRETVTIGEGTSTTYVTPFNSLWGYSFVEQIFTAAEIGTAGTINSISFNLRESDASQTNQIDVFMKNVSRDSFSSSTDFETVAASDMVFSGTVTFNPGWSTITLDSPFAYDGTSNLLIGIHEYTSGYSTRYFYYTSASDKVLSYHSDSANPDPYNLGAYSGNKYTSANRANIQIEISGGGGSGSGDNPYGPGTEPVQEPRESVIVWSNCLDKDMYLDNVTVNVLLNSADSPEGTTVDFTNLNEVEQQNYPIEQLVLDESGFYAFETFRRGEYAIKIRHEGYEPIDDTVSIWENTDLRYVMIEILYGVSNVYVSRTGWAMWDEANIPGGGGGGGQGNASTFSVNFDDGQIPAGWTTIDANNDGYNWVLGSQVGGVYLVSGASLEGSGHNSSTDLICSGSYSNFTSQAITPDNYLVSPQVTLAAGSTFSFWACAQDASYAAEHFGVFISDNGTSNWTAVQEWTMTAKSGGVMSIGRGGQTRAQGTWRQYTVDLSAFAGQKYIAIRHFNCNDQFILDVDDIELTAGTKGGLNFAKGGEFYNQYAEDGLMLNFFALDNVDLRAYLLYVLSNDSRFSLVPEEEYGQFILTSNVANNFMNEFVTVYQNAIADFSLLSKVEIAERIVNWKSSVSSFNLTSIMMDVLLSNARVDNDHCVNSLPFCTSETITFEAANTSNTANEPGMDDGCIGYSYNPSFYHMRIHTGGPFVIHMEGHDPTSGTDRDIDFCMWGPYTEQEVISGTACSNLTGNKIMDCCYSASYSEDCYLGYAEGQHQHNTSHGTINYHMPEVGEYYILMITNYSQQPCQISFTKTEGEGETDCEIVTPTDLIGFLITEDGEYVAFAGPDDREYTVEGEFGDHEYCVRPIYPGQMVLPDHNYGWSMGCPVCEFGPTGGTCSAYAPIHGEAINATDQVKIWWGEENPGPGPGGCEGDEFTVDFESGMPAGWTTMDVDGDGYNWVLGSNVGGIYLVEGASLAGSGHNSSGDLICSGSYSNVVGALSPDNWLISPEVTLCEGSTFSFWACGQDASYVAEHFGVAVSEDGSTYAMVQEWTMTAKDGGVMSIGRDGNTRAQGSWHQYTVDLSAYAGDGRHIAIRHFNCTDMFILDVDDIQLTSGAKNRASIENFKVYRSTDNTNYDYIATVPYVAGQTYYEYIDTPAGAGTYYYQVVTVYDNGCESDPAAAYDNPSNNYVEVGVTGLGENNGKVALYPNPTKGNVTIEANGMSRITVVSMLGQVVFDTELNADNYTLNMAQFNAGMYMVRVYTEEGVTVKRVTVMQ